MRTISTLATLALLGTSLVATACGGGVGGTDPTDSPEASVDSTESTQAEGDMMMASMDGADMQGFAAPTGDQVAIRIAANVAARWPGGCAVATATGANVVVTYTDCTGPRGLVHVSGELDLAITVALTGVISVHATSDSLQVNRADLVIDATADYSIDATSHHLAVTSHGSGTGPRGNAIDHDGAYTIDWDTATLCRRIKGSWSTEISNGSASRDRSTDVDLERCDTGCPTGTLTHHFLLGASITVTFDGTNVAQWSASTGTTGSVNLTCQ